VQLDDATRIVAGFQVKTVRVLGDEQREPPRPDHPGKGNTSEGGLRLAQ
jgi:hypothetical protein